MSTRELKIQVLEIKLQDQSDEFITSATDLGDANEQLLFLNKTSLIKSIRPVGSQHQLISIYSVPDSTS